MRSLRCPKKVCSWAELGTPPIPMASRSTPSHSPTPKKKKSHSFKNDSDVALDRSFARRPRRGQLGTLAPTFWAACSFFDLSSGEGGETESVGWRIGGSLRGRVERLHLRPRREAPELREAWGEFDRRISSGGRAFSSPVVSVYAF